MAPGGVTRDSVVSVSADQVSCDMGGETAILHAVSGNYFGLNGVGVRVWDLIQRPQSVGVLLKTLLDEYDVEPAQCERDLLAILNTLADRGLIQVENEKTD